MCLELGDVKISLFSIFDLGSLCYKSLALLKWHRSVRSKGGRWEYQGAGVTQANSLRKQCSWHIWGPSENSTGEWGEEGESWKRQHWRGKRVQSFFFFYFCIFSKVEVIKYAIPVNYFKELDSKHFGILLKRLK